MNIKFFIFIFFISIDSVFSQHVMNEGLLKKYKIDLDIINKIDLKNSFGFGEGIVAEKFSSEFQKKDLEVKSSNYRYFVSLSYGWSFKREVDLVVENYKGVIIDKENDDLILATFQCNKAKELDKTVELTVEQLIHSIRMTKMDDKQKFIDITDHFEKMEMNFWDSSRPDSHGPLGIHGDHCHEKGGLMFSYRYMTMGMSGNFNGNTFVYNDQIFDNYNTAGESMKMNMHMFGIMYGIAKNLTLMMMLGHTSKSMNLLTKKNVKFQTNSSGINDIKIISLYRIINKSRYKIHTNMGLSIPSGKIDARDNTPSADNMKLPYAMQIGSGTWNIILGMTSHFQFNKFSGGMQPIYLLNAGKNSQGYRLGNNLDLSYWVGYKIFNWASANFRFQNKFLSKIKGIDAQLMPSMVPTADTYNYGSKNLTGSLGMNFMIPSGTFQGLRIGLEYLIPLYQNYDGIQMGMDNNFLIGLQFSPGGHQSHH